MENKNGVRFIKKNGRIIPIRSGLSNERVKQGTSALAIAGVGLGIAAVAGVVAAKFHLEAAYSLNAAKGFQHAVETAKNLGTAWQPTAKLANAAMKEHNAFHKAGQVVKGIGVFGGGAFLGRSVAKALENTETGKRASRNEFVSTGIVSATTGLASVAIGAAYNKQLGGSALKFTDAFTAAARRYLVKGLS